MAPKVFPVVHVEDAEQALRQVDVAFECGADGVYLIDHNLNTAEWLAEIVASATAAHPGRFVGVNFLQLHSAMEAFEFLARARAEGVIERYPDGLWMDDALPCRRETVELRAGDPELAAVSYLGGVAFKYTRTHTEDPAAAAEQARDLAPYVDVVTTSGPGTGSAANPDKVAAMRAAAGGKPVAVASGVGIDNYARYTPVVDQVLVATSVETHPYSGLFDPAKLAALAAAIHSA